MNFSKLKLILLCFCITNTSYGNKNDYDFAPFPSEFLDMNPEHPCERGPVADELKESCMDCSLKTAQDVTIGKKCKPESKASLACNYPIPECAPGKRKETRDALKLCIEREIYACLFPESDAGFETTPDGRRYLIIDGIYYENLRAN